MGSCGRGERPWEGRETVVWCYSACRASVQALILWGGGARGLDFNSPSHFQFLILMDPESMQMLRALSLSICQQSSCQET